MEPARKFKIIINSKECGTCSGSSPSAVANKVVKKLCGSSSKVVRFSLKECKRGCERVCGPYQGRMEKLDRPCKRGGKTITHRVVCGKVRKMRGGLDLRVEDFEKEGNNNYKKLFKLYESTNKHKYRYLAIRHKTNNHKKKISEYNNELVKLRRNLHNHVKIEENKNDNILYTYFGTITILVNKIGYYDYYKYVIITDNQNNVIFLQLNLDFSITKVNFDDNRIDDELKDYLFVLYRTLENEPNDNKLRIQNFIKEILKIKNESANSNSNQDKNKNGPAHVSIPVTLSNGCIEYPADYKFSGKINNIPYNTNKLFRGNSKHSKRCKLYLFNPTENTYDLLLTELDYLVNIYYNGKPFEITYSGLFFSQEVIAGSTKINISDIEKFLYCPKSFSNLKNKGIRLKVKNRYFNNRSIQFPCWIIFKKGENEGENGPAYENESGRGHRRGNGSAYENESGHVHRRGNGPAYENESGHVHRRGNGSAHENRTESKGFDMERICVFTKNNIIKYSKMIYNFYLNSGLSRINKNNHQAYNELLRELINKIRDSVISFEFHLDQSQVVKGSHSNIEVELNDLSEYLKRFGNTHGVTVTPTGKEITIKGETLIEFCRNAIYEYYKK